MVFIVVHSIILVTSLLRVILIHYEMMFRHAQSHQCVSSWCILLQEWRHNHRKYSLHPSLTNRHRSSSTLLQLITERHVTPLCATHPQHPLPIHLRAHSAASERALSLCEHGNNDDPHLKWWKSNQNRGNDNKWSFPPNRLKSTPNHVTNHPHRIHAQIWIKSQPGKSTQSNTETPPFSFFPFLQSTKCNEIRIYPFIHTIQINHPNAATHASVFHLNSRLNLLSIQPTIT